MNVSTSYCTSRWSHWFLACSFSKIIYFYTEVPYFKIFFFNSNDFFFQLKMKKNKRNFVTESCKTPWLWKTSTSCPHLTSPPINHSLPAFLPPLSSLSTSLSSAPHHLIFFFSLVLLRLSVAALMHSHRPFIHADVLFIKADVFHPPSVPLLPSGVLFLPRPSTVATLSLISLPNTWSIPRRPRHSQLVSSPLSSRPVWVSSNTPRYNRTCEASKSHVSYWEGERGTARWVMNVPV